MDVAAYFESLTQELNSVKDRVRQIIGSNSWQTDGEWKESVLRGILRRHLPTNVGVGRGFVVEPEGCSTQIDILLYDSTKPLLYRDGDLVLLTSDAVLGIVEVKTRVGGRREIEEILSKLATSAEFVNRNRLLYAREFLSPGFNITGHSNPRPRFQLRPFRGLFVGLFAYETDLWERDSGMVLHALRDAAQRSRQRIVNHVSLGNSLFFRYWHRSPTLELNYHRWHAYELIHRAPGYFINNIVDMVSESVRLNQTLWFPEEGKEIHKIGELPFIPAEHFTPAPARGPRPRRR
jgi:hypothetical protein